MAAKFNFSFALFDDTFSDCTLRLQLTGKPPRSAAKGAESSSDDARGASLDPRRPCASVQEELEHCELDGQGSTWQGGGDCPPADGAGCVSQKDEKPPAADLSELANEASREGVPHHESAETPGMEPELTEQHAGELPTPAEDPLLPSLQPSGIESPDIWKENCERWDSGSGREAGDSGPLHAAEPAQAGGESQREDEVVIVEDEARSSSSVDELPAVEPGGAEACTPQGAAPDGTSDKARQSPRRGSHTPAPAEAPAQEVCDETCKRSDSGCTRDIPVSSVILAAKSTFFRELFSTTAAQQLVLLEMPHSDEAFFLELLSFFYTGALSCTLCLSYANILKLLVVAHRFGSEECVEHCADALRPFISSLTPDQASMLMDLPGAVQERELLWPLLRSAKATILQHYTPLLKTPTLPRVLDMSEGTLLALLQSGELDVGSEDVVARAALAWVRNRYASRRERQEAIRTLVVPNIRLAALSPRFIESLQRLREFHPRDLQQQLFNALIQAATEAAEPQGGRPGSASPKPIEGPQARESARPTGTKGKQKELVLQASPLANRPRNRGTRGETGQRKPPMACGPPGEAVPKENVHSRPHRIGYQPPSGTLYLGLVVKRSALWTPGSGFCLLSSTSIVCGRRMIFGAKLEKQSRQAILGLYLLAVVGHAESFSCRFKFSCRPVGSTGDFWPLCAQAVPVNFSARSPQWGLKNALGKPWCRFLREAREGGVQEFEFRADIWMQT